MAANRLTVANVQKRMKNYWIDRKDIQDTTDISHTILDLMTVKEYKGFGTKAPFFLGRGTTFGYRDNYATQHAASMTKDVSSDELTITVPLMSTFQALDMESYLDAMQGGEHKLFDFIVDGVDAVESSMRDELARTLVTPNNVGNGLIGRIKAMSLTGLNYFYFEDPASAVSIDQGATLVVTDSPTGTTRTGTLTVLDSNPITGKVICDATLTDDVSAIASQDYVFLEGWKASDGSITTMYGIDAWFGTSDIFGSGSRVSKSRLVGTTIGCKSKSVTDACSYALQVSKRLSKGAQGKYVFLCGTIMRHTIEKELQGKLQRGELKGASALLFETIMVNGETHVVEEPFMPDNLAYLLKLDTWSIYARKNKGDWFILGDVDNGEIWSKNADSTAYVVPCNVYANLFCHLPICNIKLDFATDPTGTW